MKTDYSTLDIVKLLGIPRERLREWITRGFIRPSIQEARGQGTKALFSREDLYTISVFRDLVDNGLSRYQAAACAYSATKGASRTTKYTIFKTGVFRKADWIDARTGKPDGQKGDAMWKLVLTASNKEELLKTVASTDGWSQLLIIDLAEIKEAVDKALGE